MDKTDWRDTERIPNGPKPGWGRNYLQGNLGTVSQAIPHKEEGSDCFSEISEISGATRMPPGIIKRECKTMPRMGAAIL